MIINLSRPDAGASASGTLHPAIVDLLGSEECCLLELQGSLESEGDVLGQSVGELTLDPTTNKPILQIGHHRLEGTIQSLPKPYAVIARAPAAHQPSLISPNSMPHSPKTGTEIGGNLMVEDENPREAVVELEANGTANMAYNIITIVRKKMVFSKRPVPIVPQSAVKSTAVTITGLAETDE